MSWTDPTNNQLPRRIPRWPPGRHRQCACDTASSVLYQIHLFGPHADCRIRNLQPENINAVLQRGQSLWKSVYHPFETKLSDRLAQSHPDLPVHIIESEYGNLFSDPPSPANGMPATVGRVLTSIVAVACLRAQTGVGPQVVSHVFGLRKAFEDGTAKAADEEEVQGGEWLASDEGSIWLLGWSIGLWRRLGRGRGPVLRRGCGGRSYR
jgi:hypothetical protein